MFDWLASAYEGSPQKYKDRYSPPAGASDADLDRMEKRIGVPLPESYKAFLRRWNGLERFRHATLDLYDVDKVLAWHDEWAPFRPYTGKDELPADGDEYYAEKPAHLLVIRRLPHGNELDCFDTRALVDGEYPVLRYDMDLDPPVRPAFPSFEAMMLRTIAEVVDGDDNALRDQLSARMAARGATELDEIFPNWSGWRHAPR